MALSSIRLVSLIALCVLTAHAGVRAQSNDATMTRLRPIGSPSAVDRYRGPAQTVAGRQTVYPQASVPPRNPSLQVSASVPAGVRQTVMQQPFAAPQLPATTLPATTPGNFTPPPTTSPASPAATPSRNLPNNPGLGATNGELIPVPQDRSILTPGSDLAPLAPPELSNGFATIDNCNCVSAPSDHFTASVIDGCAPVSYQTPAYQTPAYQTPVYQAPGYATPQTYAVAPSAMIAPVVLPNGLAAPPGSVAPAGTLMSFGQEVYPVQVGQGWWGQPVAYVPGQPVRNWFRYLFP